jgi:hypothetical protein
VTVVRCRDGCSVQRVSARVGGRSSPRRELAAVLHAVLTQPSEGSGSLAATGVCWVVQSFENERDAALLAAFPIRREGSGNRARTSQPSPVIVVFGVPPPRLGGLAPRRRTHGDDRRRRRGVDGEWRTARGSAPTSSARCRGRVRPTGRRVPSTDPLASKSDSRGSAFPFVRSRCVPVVAASVARPGRRQSPERGVEVAGDRSRSHGPTLRTRHRSAGFPRRGRPSGGAIFGRRRTGHGSRTTRNRASFASIRS